jgi:hypothetical protein
LDKVCQSFARTDYTFGTEVGVVNKEKDCTTAVGCFSGLRSLGDGAWTLKYDSVKDNQKTALSVKNTNSGRWKEARVTLTDANFGNPCPNSTDLMLVNASKSNTLFHMIELLRKN